MCTPHWSPRSPRSPLPPPPSALSPGLLSESPGTFSTVLGLSRDLRKVQSRLGSAVNN